jgi:hypothetical protein
MSYATVDFTKRRSDRFDTNYGKQARSSCLSARRTAGDTPVPQAFYHADTPLTLLHMAVRITAADKRNRLSGSVNFFFNNQPTPPQSGRGTVVLVRNLTQGTYSF